MAIIFPQIDLPRGIRGGSGMEDEGPAGIILAGEYFNTTVINPPIFSVTQGNKSATNGTTTTMTWEAVGDSIPTLKVQRYVSVSGVPPEILSVSNIALTTANSQTPSVTVPATANAFIINSQYYTTTAQTITFSGSSWMTVQASGGDWDFNWANSAYAAGKITATGAQTLTVSALIAFDEGPTCQIIWLKVENPEDWILDHQIDPPNNSPDILSVIVNSQVGGFVIGVLGDFLTTISAPSGTTQIGTSQTTNGHTTLAYSVNSVGATTTTVTAASYAFPTLLAISVKASSGGISEWVDVTTGTNYTGTSPLTYTTPTLSELLDNGSQWRCVATNTEGSVNSASMTLTVLAGVLSNIKHWNGTSWVAGVMKYWNGSSWIAKTLKRWNGTSWI